MGLDFAIENAYVGAVPVVPCGRTDVLPWQRLVRCRTNQETGDDTAESLR
jgi:hypothetical protein